MSTPFHEIPDPASTVAGRNNRGILTDLTKKIALWRPKGAREPGISTIARFAHRVMGSDGNAYLADELGSGTTETILDKLKGTVADPERIGTEYLPEALEVASVQLTDTGASSLPAGSLGLNSSGELIIHDDVRNGDDVAPFASSNLRQGFIGQKITAELQTSTEVLICRLRLPASESAVGKFIGFDANFFLSATFSVAPDIGIYMALRKHGETDIGKWNTWAFDTLPIQAYYKISAIYKVESGNLFTTIRTTACGTREEVGSTNAAITSHTSCFADNIFVTDANAHITSGQPVDLELVFFTLNDAASVAGGYFIHGSASAYSA
jgi:hypothetical protein